MNWSVYWHSGQYSTLVAPVYWSVYRVDTKVTRRGVVKLLEHLCIGRVSLACENEAGGSWGQKVHILHVNV